MRHRYLAFYKPYNVLTQFTDPDGTGWKTLKDFIPAAGVYPVGRLDRDSEGLLLMTNDGALAHRLTNPKYAHPRTYWVEVEGTVTEAALEQLRRGVLIQGVKTRPARARALREEPALPPREPPVRFRKSIPTAWIELTLTEGRNRQVRRMTAAVGLPTLRLVRVSIGALRLGNLAPGEWRELDAQEVAQWKRDVSLP